MLKILNFCSLKDTKYEKSGHKLGKYVCNTYITDKIIIEKYDMPINE